ncbi:trypsin-like serine peptidase [Phenylobacterium soli]|uniref:trypsin-like serine peptidase n=1 Tax=Phenylobacterium soli TaxID=2170551 RepID=UPI0014030864|nr:trypsin-like peptidase domain-containing protein [Phenylobacterium soli]
MLLKQDPTGRIVTVRVPTTTSNEVVIDPQLMKDLPTFTKPELITRFREGEQSSALADFLTKLGATSQTIDPRSTDVTLANLKPQWRDRAKVVGWTGPVCAYTPDCLKARTDFANRAEHELFDSDGGLTRIRTDPERQDFIALSKAFDAACLQKVTPGGAPPLQDLAVISGAYGPYCMAVHVGGDRFLTARHCFFDPATGQPWPEAAKATVSLVDRSVSDAPVAPAAVQPLPAPANLRSSRSDILVIEAHGLPQAVRLRAAPAVVAPTQLSGVMVSEALLVGYFVLADAERAIPGPGGHSDPPAWTEALRSTRKVGAGYCRLWDYTAVRADGSACIQHSCQTEKGFSGSPVFVRRDDGVWAVAGVHVNNAENPGSQECGDFVGRAGTGVLMERGGIAAAVPASLAASLASPVRLARNGSGRGR